jgi:hypothetical protein
MNLNVESWDFRVAWDTSTYLISTLKFLDEEAMESYLNSMLTPQTPSVLLKLLPPLLPRKFLDSHFTEK